LKKAAKTFTPLSRVIPRQPRKSLLVLFFRKELLPYLTAILTTKATNAIAPTLTA
jgi:hypothetical protein